MQMSEKKTWHVHTGQVLNTVNGFDVIACEHCGFKHIIPIPTEEELSDLYQHDYYNQEKPLYLERYQQDLPWWNQVYQRRYQTFEQYLPKNRRRILDIGSGPGYFLLHGQTRGWQTTGIEPSVRAAEHSQSLGLTIKNGFFSESTAKALGKFDVVNMSLVLEHIPAPAALLSLVHQQLDDSGLLCLIVPNDFNPFQKILAQHAGFAPWWVAPPHHINYFDFNSLSSLVTRCGFEVLQQEATFPIDLFLLMGENYIGNDDVGRACHSKRMQFEQSLHAAGADGLLNQLYSALASLGLGREVVLFARKK